MEPGVLQKIRATGFELNRFRAGFRNRVAELQNPT